ncbi:cache and HAMP domain-containing protein [Salipiger sp.]|uniref:HAMP domain-containing protein n=1 Tax=Salipiger sp. TaxID=2078585 RepID=UPI003A971020
MPTASNTTSVQMRPTLAAATYTFVALTLLIVTCVAGVLLWNRSDRLIDDALDSAVRLRTSAAGQIVARSLHEDMQDLRALAGSISEADDATMRGMIKGLRGDAGRLSWIGYAGTDGRVRAASDGLLEGADVSERPWFRNGLQQREGFAGDVHDAVLLAGKLRPEGGDPIRFVDLAVPVQNGTGEVTGVLGMHIDAEWVRKILAETGEFLSIDLFLIDRAGTIIMAPDGVDPSPDDVGILRAARSGTQTSAREVWPDGKVYFSSLVPSVGYADLPSFGWRLAGRIGANAFRPSLSSLLTSVLVAAGISLTLLLLLTALFVRVVLRPISGLASAADRIAAGEDEYPPDLRGTREAWELSSALGRMQAKRL